MQSFVEAFERHIVPVFCLLLILSVYLLVLLILIGLCHQICQFILRQLQAVLQAKISVVCIIFQLPLRSYGYLFQTGQWNCRAYLFHSLLLLLGMQCTSIVVDCSTKLFINRNCGSQLTALISCSCLMLKLLFCVSR